jgi:hypothetical protein
MVRKTFVPQWLSDVFVKAYEDVCTARAGSWDDVFGGPWPKGTHLKQLNNRWSKALPIWQAVETARMSGEKIDDGLFTKGRAIRRQQDRRQQNLLRYEKCRRRD